MPPAKPVARPLSPHLQVYRLPLAAILSITHRIAGVGLAIGVLLLTWWVTAAAIGPGAYDKATDFIGSIVGQLLLLGFSLALFFHLCNGIRHLVWDAGKGFEKSTTATSNVVVIVAALTLTAVSWLFAKM
jgi:succinate dehydrogenase / fumarate reductase cytochrome b subunit